MLPLLDHFTLESNIAVLTPYKNKLVLNVHNCTDPKNNRIALMGLYGLFLTCEKNKKNLFLVCRHICTILFFLCYTLSLVATALFFHVISRPQVPLNLAAQVTCDLAMRRRTPSLLPPHRSCRKALDTVSFVTISFNIVSVACQVSN